MTVTPAPTLVETFVAAAPKASFWIRAVGAIIEFAATVAVAYGLGVLRLLVSDVSAGVAMLLGVLGLQLWFAWQNGVSGQSLGKGLLGLQTVSRRTGQPPGGAVGLGRFFVAWVISVVTCGLGSAFDYLWPLGDAQRQTLHDKAVDTVVLRDRGRRTLRDLLKP